MNNLIVTQLIRKISSARCHLIVVWAIIMFLQWLRDVSVVYTYREGSVHSFVQLLEIVLNYVHNDNISLASARIIKESLSFL